MFNEYARLNFMGYLMKRRLNTIFIVATLTILSSSCKDQEFYEKEIYQTFQDQNLEEVIDNPVGEITYTIDQDYSEDHNGDYFDEYALDNVDQDNADQGNTEEYNTEEYDTEENDNPENLYVINEHEHEHEHEEEISDNESENYSNANNDSDNDSDSDSESNEEIDTEFASDENQTIQEDQLSEVVQESDNVSDNVSGDENGDESKTSTNQFKIVTDEFLQLEQSSKLDILWVIDNSGSMEDEQAALAYNFNNFINEFIRKDIDFNMAITTTDTSGNYGTRNSLTKRSIAKLRRKSLDNNKEKFLSDFANLIQVGTSGSGKERGLQAVDDFVQKYKSHPRFFREDAYFVTVIVTDEDDQSIATPLDYVNSIKSKLHDPTKFKIYSIVNHSTTTNSQWYVPGHTRYLETTNLVGGKIADIDQNFHVTLQNMGVSIVRLSNSFALKHIPSDDQIKVFINEIEAQSGWVYDQDTRTISFQNNYVPQAGSKIKIQYLTKE